VTRVATKAVKRRGVPVDLVIAFTLATLFKAVRRHTRGSLSPLEEETEQ
jgi:hypothetical protein